MEELKKKILITLMKNSDLSYWDGKRTAPSHYVMQTANLPRYIFKDIHRLNRNFLWGDTPTKRKIHLMECYTVS